METIYIPTIEFTEFIKSQKENANPVSFEGHNRWVITREDGTTYIARPENTK